MMELDAILEQIKEDIARKKLKHEHPYTLDIVRVLWTHKDGLARGRVIDNLERQRKRDGLDIPPKFEESVQGTYNAHCIGYSAFEKKGLPESEALFDSPGGKGSGVWGLNLNNPRLKR